MKKFAAFDIDGTIFRWQLSHELFDELYRRAIISNDDAAPVFKVRRQWQNRQASYDDYQEVLVKLMEDIMIGLPVAEVNSAAATIIATKSSRIYRYTSSLLKSLKEQGYFIIALSGSQQQLVERFAKPYDIDVIYGRRFAIDDGVFVGAGEHVFSRKADILKEVIAENNLTLTDSYAVGDTNDDGDMMDLVENPVAFNPDRHLYERARKNNWTIVVERKNMAYELKPDGSSYILA